MLESFVVSLPPDLCDTPTKELTLSIDAPMMGASQKILDGVLSTLVTKNVHQGAVLVYDAREKKILTYIAARKEDNPQANAIDMITRRRSVGSILKPFIYLMALQQ